MKDRGLRGPFSFLDTVDFARHFPSTARVRMSAAIALNVRLSFAAISLSFCSTRGGTTARTMTPRCRLTAFLFVPTAICYIMLCIAIPVPR